MATMIERAMTEQARGIRQVSDAITNVMHMASQIASAMQAQSKGTEMILHTAEEMRDTSRRVKIAMTEQGRGGQQIAVAADNVTVRAGRIAAGTGERQAMEQIWRLRRGSAPPTRTKRMEDMAAAIKTLGEQADLLGQEIVAMTAGKGAHGKSGMLLREVETARGDPIDANMALKFVVALTGVIMVLGSLFVTQMLLKYQYRAIEVRGRETGTVLGKAVIDRLIANDEIGINALVEDVVKSADVLSMIIVRMDGLPVTTARASFNRGNEEVGKILAAEKTGNVNTIAETVRRRLAPIEVSADISRRNEAGRY
jgi:hypothetical protein